MANLKRFAGNTSFTSTTIANNDIFPFQHNPNADGDCDGKITVSELATKVTSDCAKTSDLAAYQAKLTAGSNIAIDEETNEISCDVSTMNFKGSVETYDTLPTDADVGDVWNVTGSNTNYCWNGTAWVVIGSSIDISPITSVIPSDASSTNKLVSTDTVSTALADYLLIANLATQMGSLQHTSDNIYYCTLANGIKVMWQYRDDESGTRSITFPLTFNTTPFAIAHIIGSNSSDNTNMANFAYNLTETGMTYYTGSSYPSCWFAIGY